MIKHVALGIDWRFGRVEIFRHVVAQRPGAERHDLSGFIGNGKRDAPPEAVEQPSAVLVARDQTGLDQQLFVVLRFQMPKQSVAAAWCIANSETRNRILIQTAIFEVRQRGFPFESSFDLLYEKSLCLAVHFDENRA